MELEGKEAKKNLAKGDRPNQLFDFLCAAYRMTFSSSSGDVRKAAKEFQLDPSMINLTAGAAPPRSAGVDRPKQEVCREKRTSSESRVSEPLLAGLWEKEGCEAGANYNGPRGSTSEACIAVFSKPKIHTLKAAVLSDESSSSDDESQEFDETPKEVALREDQIELEINVIDGRKQLKSTFKCNKLLLTSSMGYFKDIAQGKKLEEMDISVHCDIQVFDWLMRWIKRKENTSAWPQLTPKNLVSILVASFFLRMDELVQECLDFFKKNPNEVILADSNIGSVNEKLLEMISEMFSNTEVESFDDPKDCLQTKLFVRLIISLWRGDFDEKKGHFGTLKYLRKCTYCHKVIDIMRGHAVPCSYENLRLDVYGRVHGMHVADAKWSLASHIKKLRNELGSWRNTYWKLWGLCHHLYCSTCDTYFPAYYALCCEYHGKKPVFGPSTGNVNTNEGHYPCCGQRVFRFNPLPTYSGCLCQNHTPQKKPNIPQEVYAIFEKHEHLIVGDPEEINGRKKPPRSSSFGNSPSESDVFNLQTMPQADVICWLGMNNFPPTINCILGLPRVNQGDKPANRELTEDKKKQFTVEYSVGGCKMRELYHNRDEQLEDESDESDDEDCSLMPDRIEAMFSTYFPMCKKKRKRYFMSSLKRYFKNHPNEPENTQDDFMREHEYQLMTVLIGRLVKKNSMRDAFSDIWPKYSNATDFLNYMAEVRLDPNNGFRKRDETSKKRWGEAGQNRSKISDRHRE